jgi:hypothetical protein
MGKNFVADGACLSGKLVGRLARTDQIDHCAGMGYLFRYVAYVDHDQVHRDAAHEWNRIVAQMEMAMPFLIGVAQLAGYAIGVSAGECRKARTAGNMLRGSVANGHIPVNWTDHQDRGRKPQCIVKLRAERGWQIGAGKGAAGSALVEMVVRTKEHAAAIGERFFRLRKKRRDIGKAHQLFAVQVMFRFVRAGKVRHDVAERDTLRQVHVIVLEPGRV